MKFNAFHRLFLCIAVILIMLGCSTPDNSEPPAELTEIEDAEYVREVWSTSAGSSIHQNFYDLRPLVVDNKVYTIDIDGNIYSVDLTTGRTDWTFESGIPAIAGLSGDSTRLLATSRDGDVVMFELVEDSLKQKWKRQLSSEIRSQAVLDNDKIFIRSGDGKLHALEAETGDIKWTVSRRVPALSLTGNSLPVLTQDLVISGFDNGKLVAFERENGSTAWETTIGSPRGRTEIERLVDLDGQFIVRDGVIYVSSYQGNMAAVTVNSGQVIWSRKFSSSKAIEADQEALYLIDDRSHLWSIDRRTGSAFWKQDVLNARKITAAVSLGDRLVVGDLDGYAHFFRRSDGKLMARIRLGEERFLSQPVKSGNLALLLDTEGLLAAVTQEKSK